MYKTKQSQREATLENAKKEFENNIRKQRFESFSLYRPSQLQVKTKNFTIRATSPTFNTEQRFSATIKGPSALHQLTSPRNSVYKIDPSTTILPEKMTTNSEENVKEIGQFCTDTKGLVKVVEACDPAKKSMISKLKFLSQTPELEKIEGSFEHIEQVKLFDDLDPRTMRIKKSKLLISNSAEQSPLLQKKKDGRGLADFIISNMSKRRRNRKSTFSQINEKSKKSNFEEERLETNFSAELDESLTSPTRTSLVVQTEPSEPQKYNKVDSRSRQSPESALKRILCGNTLSTSPKGQVHIDKTALNESLPLCLEGRSVTNSSLLSPKIRKLTIRQVSRQERVLSPVSFTKNMNDFSVPLIAINGLIQKLNQGVDSPHHTKNIYKLPEQSLSNPSKILVVQTKITNKEEKYIAMGRKGRAKKERGRL